MLSSPIGRFRCHRCETATIEARGALRPAAPITCGTCGETLGTWGELLSEIARALADDGRLSPRREPAPAETAITRRKPQRHAVERGRRRIEQPPHRLATPGER
ncbi:MAG TPA: hypothetical protein VIL09_17805 [Microvirga sp.]|jgi:hypothetical protein